MARILRAITEVRRPQDDPDLGGFRVHAAPNVTTVAIAPAQEPLGEVWSDYQDDARRE